MTLKKIIEYVQQHHPHMGEAEIVDRANRLIKTICKDFDVLESSWSQDTTAGQRYYDLTSNSDPSDTSRIETVKDVYLERKKIPRIEKPIIEDDNEPGTW